MLTSEIWLLLDCSYLAHRVRWQIRNLQHEDMPTNVIFGFLRTIRYLVAVFRTERLIFCWDGPTSLCYRTAVLPQYKQHRRRILTKSETKEEQDFYRQIDLLRGRYLPMIGFRNIWYDMHLESDDLIAAGCTKLTQHKLCGIIVTADQDLYQCIRPNIFWYNPRTIDRLTYSHFVQTYKITPQDWVKVLAIAGCDSDNVPGVLGVGKKTALKFVCGELSRDSKAYHSIWASWKTVVLRNRRLVQLPWPDVTIEPRLHKDNVTQDGWDRTTKEIGMKGRIQWVW